MAGKTGLMTSVATTASGGGVGGGTKQYTYKELEDLINKVYTCIYIALSTRWWV